ATPLLAIQGSPAVTAVFGTLTALFLMFGLRTWLRQGKSVEVTEEAISARRTPALSRDRRSIAWRDLDKVKLSYYSTKRDRAEGWMQLSLKGGRTTLKIDSTLDGFVEIAAQTAAAVTANGIELRPVTVSNFAALGITFEDSGPTADGGRRADA
ncbi:MAG: hypothetical protein ACE5JZ_12905, partial [Kiloniellales bacterium]